MPGYETHTVRDIIIYDDVDAELYDTDLLPVLRRPLEGSHPLKQSTGPMRRFLPYSTPSTFS